MSWESFTATTVVLMCQPSAGLALNIAFNQEICATLLDTLKMYTIPVLRVYAPPAWILLQALHFQMPTAERLTLYLPQKLQKYLECWLTSIFLICFRSEAPYRVPYLPTIPTFFVRLDIAASYLQT